MQLIYRLTSLLILTLLIIGLDGISNSPVIFDQTNSFKGNVALEVIESEMDIQSIYTSINKFVKAMEGLCTQGSSPIFNELSYTCKVDNNNRYVSTKLNSLAPITNTMIINAKGNIFSRSENISATDMITGQTSNSNIGESSFRYNILGRRTYINEQGKKFQYLRDLYSTDDSDYGNMIAFKYLGTILDDIEGKRHNNAFEIQNTDLKSILTYSIYNKGSNISSITLPADNITSKKNEYITSSSIFDYSDTNWDSLTAELDRYISRGDNNKALANNTIRSYPDLFIDRGLDQIFSKRTIAQVQDL